MKPLSIQSIKEAVQPSEVFYDLLGKPVKMAGKNQVYFCRFHDDKKTPNLHIKPDGRYHCFRCKADGDFIDLFQKITGVTELPEALRMMFFGMYFLVTLYVSCWIPYALDLFTADPFLYIKILFYVYVVAFGAKLLFYGACLVKTYIAESRSGD